MKSTKSGVNRNPQTLYDVMVELTICLRNKNVRGVVELQHNIKNLDMPQYKKDRVHDLYTAAIMALTMK